MVLYDYKKNKKKVFFFSQHSHTAQMYGVSRAVVAVGYEYSACERVVWEVQTAPMRGFHLAISDVGGWNLDIHHMYNFESGELNLHYNSVNVCMVEVELFILILNLLNIFA